MRKYKSGKRGFAFAVVLLAAAGILLLAKLVWNTDAREIYFEAESKNFRKYSQWINDNYTSFMEKQKPYMDMAYRRRMELTADIKSSGKPFGLNNADRLFDLVKRSKLVVDTKRQPREDVAISGVSLLMEKVPFLDAEIFSKAGMLYFTVPVLLPDKYFSVKLDKLDDVYDKFSIPVRPERLIKGTDIAQTLQFDATALNNSADKLGDVFSRLITEGSVNYGEEREVTLSGQVVKGREVLVSLDESAATVLLGELAAFIAEDKTLLSLTHGNFADISTMLDDAGLFRLIGFLHETGVAVLTENENNLVGKLNVRKDLEGFGKYLKETLSSYVLKDGLSMVVVIDKAGNILDRKLSLDLADRSGGKSFKLDINTGSSSTLFEDCRNRFLKIVATEQGEDGNSDIGNSISTGNNSSDNTNNNNTGSTKTTELRVMSVFAKPDGTDTLGNIAVSYAVAAQDGGKSRIDIELDISDKTDNLTLKKNNIIKYRVKMVGGSGEGSMKGELNSVAWKNKKLNTANITTRLSAQADLPFFGIKDMSAVVNLAREDRLGIELPALPDVQQSVVIDLNAASGKELDLIEMEMMSYFGTFYLTNKPVFDAIFGQ